MATISDLYEGFNSKLSLQPLVIVLKKMITEGKPGARKLYEGLLRELEAVPGLLKPMEDAHLLEQHGELVESVLSTIFPPATSNQQGMHAVTVPFHPQSVYSSPGFRALFLDQKNDMVCFADQKTGIHISKASLQLAYNVILRTFYSLPVAITAESVHPFTDKETGLTRYYELRMNAQFVDVKCINPDFTLPAGFSPQRTLELQELKELFPLGHFQFEGLLVIDVSEVTVQQVIVEIKNALLNINAFSDVTVYDELQRHVQSLMGLKDLKIGITPFFKMNNLYLYTEAHYRNSLLFHHPDAIKHKDDISEVAQEVFRHTAQPILYAQLTENSVRHNQLLRHYFQQGGHSLILCPLKSEEDELIGLLEVMSHQPDLLEFGHLSRLQPVIQLFALALGKSYESIELQIDKTVKEHFTAVQPAVEWKFTEAAFNYLQHRQVNELAKMPAISFDDVYPIYGSIDVRNSSVERSNAIQLDLLEQLGRARDVLERATKAVDFPLLKEEQFRIERYIELASDTLLTDDEMRIYDYLQTDLDRMFRHLRATYPELRKLVEDYLFALDPQRKIVYHHRKEYEESITRINDVLDRFIDFEQQSAQDVYPHYFERYITDGLEFNIYIGQSLAPHRPFDEAYVRNLKLWQLTMLAKAARLTHALEKRLPLQLQTTQLILAHSMPLSISFRRKERKFDVDGAYNIRYEIVKKRIDKVHLKDSEERLTQPGRIAIVYSQQRELTEYMDYIDFLTHEQLLVGEVEHMELEDTQGISGLRAIRVTVNLSNEPDAAPKSELSKVRMNQLMRK